MPDRKLTSIVSYPERGIGGNNRYRGNCSPKLVEDLISFFKPSEICDYMCGSGTTKAAADNCKIKSNIYDLHSGFDILNCDIPERPEFVFWHPPYWDIIVYSDVMYKASDVMSKFGYDPIKHDLSRIQDWNKFVEVMNNLKASKALVVLEGENKNVVLSGRNIPTVKVSATNEINTYDVLKYETLVVTKAAVEKLEEVYA